jgi:hypothetical protein
MVIPQTLAINGGYDAVQLIQACTELHKQGHIWHAVDLECGQLASIHSLFVWFSYQYFTIQDMLELGVVEPLAVFREGYEFLIFI